VKDLAVSFHLTSNWSGLPVRMSMKIAPWLIMGALEKFSELGGPNPSWVPDCGGNWKFFRPDCGSRAPPDRE